MSVARKIFSNTVWQVAGKVVVAVLGIVSIKFITNYLSRSEYGEYTTIYDYTALFAIIADFGLFTIALREMAHDEKSTEKIIGNVLSIRTTLAVFALGLGVLAAYLIPAYSGSNIPFGVIIVSIATIITLAAGTISSVLQLHLKMHWASIALSVGKFITVGYIMAVILYIFPNNPELGFPHLLLSWILGGIVTIFITYFATRKFVKIAPQFDFKFWKEVLIKALPYGAALVLGTIYFRMGTIVLSLYKMKDAVGFWGVPMRFLEILQIIPHYFMNSVLPILTLTIKGNFERSPRIIKYSLCAMAAMSLPIFVGGYIVAYPLTAAVSSPQFLTHYNGADLILGSDVVLKILLAALIFTSLHVVLTYSLVAMGKQIELLWINAVAVIINVVLNLILAPRFGAVGAAVVAAITEMTMFILLAIRLRHYIKGIWDVSFLAKTVVSAIFMGAVLLAATTYFEKLLLPVGLLILIPLGAVAFAASMFATKAISKEMIALFRKTDLSQEEKI